MTSPKLYIIAEIGSNWQSLSDCLDSIMIAKACGADAAKFQLFDERTLFGHGFEYPSYGVSAQPPYLPPGWLVHLKKHADQHDIDFLCTAFSPEFVAVVDPYVPAHKVASSDLCYPQLLAAVARTGKPIYLSTGAKTDDEIERALDCLGPDACSRTTLLYCVAAYPAKTVDLRVMRKLDRIECAGFGFSDHTTDIIQTPLSAARFGASVMEKHFTAFPDWDTPDRGHSLTPSEFTLMVDHIRGRKEPELGPTHEEASMLLRHNRRLVAMRDIDREEKLAYGVNFGAYRSRVDDTRGMSPFYWETAEGRTVMHAIKQGEPINASAWSK